MLLLILSLFVVELLFARITTKLIYLNPIVNLAIFSLSFYFFIIHYPNLFTGFFIFFLFFKLLNAFRVIVPKKNRLYLRKVTFRTAIILDIFLSLDALFIYLSRDESAFNLYLSIISFATIFAFYVSYKTFISHKLMKSIISRESIADNELPTISVLIPARNETDDLIRCLDSVVASNYPKMEVIVLDDCSSEGRTPQIIRSFAQKGVKFISGSEPKNTWTAKNWAYQQLVDASSGDYLLFMGVDVFVKENTFKDLINSLIASKKDMINLIPINVYKDFSLYYYLLQPMRYFIEIILPQNIIESAPALSTFWVINKKSFAKLGGFRAVESTVMPEKYFARELSSRSKYIFAASDEKLGVYSDKSIEDQKETSIILTYPTLRKRPEVVSIFILLFTLIALVPLISFIVGLISLNYWVIGSSFLVIALITMSVVRVDYLAYRRRSVLDYVLVPIALIYTMAVAFESMYKYEFSEVKWKERNICIPVMRLDS